MNGAATIMAQRGLRLRIHRTVRCELVRGDAVVEPEDPEPRGQGLRGLIRDIALTLERDGAPEAASVTAALEVWRGLLDGEWFLYDRFEAGGRLFVLAQHRTAKVELPPLTRRERQVVSHALQGHANKHAAIDLGLTESTVATHLRRAMAKLGVRSRAELLRSIPLGVLDLDDERTGESGDDDDDLGRPDPR